MGSAIVPDLIAALKDSPADRRAEIVRVLGQIADPRAREPLERHLKDESAFVRRRSARALGQLNRKEAVPALLGALKDPDPEVRSRAAFALGELGDPSALVPVLAALADDAEQVRDFAAVALGRLGELRAGSALAWVLAHDASPYVRAHAAMSLGGLRVPGACGALIAALDDTSDLVRRRAHEALVTISGQNFPVTTRTGSPVRQEQIERWQSWYRSARQTLGVTRPVPPAELAKQLAQKPAAKPEGPPPLPSPSPVPSLAVPTPRPSRAEPPVAGPATPSRPEPYPAKPAHPVAAVRAYAAGTRALTEGDWVAARDLLSQAVRGDPRWADAHYNLAIAQLKSGDSDAAIGTLRRATTLAPTDSEAWALLGNILWAEGDLVGAKEALTRAARLPNPSVETLLSLATTALELREYPTAARWFSVLQERGFDRLPAASRGQAHLRAGMAFFHTNRLMVSLEHFTQAKAAGLKRPVLAEYLGHVYRLLGHYDEAVAEYRWALANGAGDDTRSGLASAYMAKNRYQEARSLLEELLERRPRDADAWLRLAVCLGHLGAEQEARQALRRARELRPDDASAAGVPEGPAPAPLPKEKGLEPIRSRTSEHPDDPEAQYLLGVALEKSGQLLQAEQHYRAAVELSPATTLFRHTLALLLIRTGKTAEAEVVLQAGAGTGDHDLELLGDLAAIKRLRGDLEGARDLYHRLVTLQPEKGRWWLELGRTCARLDELDGALESLKRANELVPDDAEVCAALARFYVDHRDVNRNWLPQAASLAARAASLSPRTAQYHALLAEIHFHAGRGKEALASIDRALLLEPTNERYAASRRRYLGAQE